MKPVQLGFHYLADKKVRHLLAPEAQSLNLTAPPISQGALLMCAVELSFISYPVH